MKENEVHITINIKRKVMRITKERFLIFKIFCIGFLSCGIDLISKKYNITVPYISTIMCMYLGWFSGLLSYNQKKLKTVYFTPILPLGLIGLQMMINLPKHELLDHHLYSGVIIFCAGVLMFLLTFIESKLSTRMIVDAIDYGTTMKDIHKFFVGENIDKYMKHKNRIIKNFLRLHAESASLHISDWSYLWSMSKKSVWRHKHKLILTLTRNIDNESLIFCESIFNELLSNPKWATENDLKKFFNDLIVRDPNEKISNIFKKCVIIRFDSNFHKKDINKFFAIFSDSKNIFFYQMYEYYEICCDRKSHYTSFNKNIHQGDFVQMSDAISKITMKSNRGNINLTARAINSGLSEILQYLQPLDINFESTNGDKYNSNSIRSNMLGVNKLYIDSQNTNHRNIDQELVLKIYKKLLQPVVELKKSGQKGLKGLVRSIVDNDLHSDLINLNITQFIMKDLNILETSS